MILYNFRGNIFIISFIDYWLGNQEVFKANLEVYTNVSKLVAFT